MFHYVENKSALSQIRNLGREVMQELCHTLKARYGVSADFFLVGSGAKNLILQDGAGPIDLDYNLRILKCRDIQDGREVRENVKSAFNDVLSRHGWGECRDSTSSLRTQKHESLDKGGMRFSLDICVVYTDKEGYLCRLIHEKAGQGEGDRCHWDRARDSSDLNRKVDFIKKSGKWLMVREEYLKIKNKRQAQNDLCHPSFVCYIEAVNNVYNVRNRWK